MNKGYCALLFTFCFEKKIMTLRICIFFVILGISYGINNGLGRIPQMGELQSEMIFDTRYSREKKLPIIIVCLYLIVIETQNNLSRK